MTTNRCGDWSVDFVSSVPVEDLGAQLFVRLARQNNDPAAGLDSITAGPGKEEGHGASAFIARPSKSRARSTSIMAKARMEDKQEVAA